MNTALAVALATALSIAGGAYAQDTTRSPAATSAQTAKVDRDTQEFFEKAAVGGIAEVQQGKLAAEKASSPEVKQFGQRMVDDHGKANEELMELASKHGVTLPADLDSKHKKTVDKLSKLSGAEFDRAYMDEMVRDHKEDVKLFEKQAQKGKNADVQQFAEKTLPTLQEHLQEAQQIQSTLKKGNKGKS